MDNQTLRNIQQNMANSPLRPIYADEIVVAHTIKSGKDKDGQGKKEAHLHLVFVDMTTQRPVDKVVISTITARGLHKALGDSLDKLDEEIKKGKIEKEKRTETDYIR